jgi:hypothetical protein
MVEAPWRIEQYRAQVGDLLCQTFVDVLNVPEMTDFR